MPKKIPVLICGAGPCGLATSFILNQFGIKNIIIEKHATTSTHPKARGVNVRTMELLHVWGLERQVRQHELSRHARKILWMMRITGNVIGEIKVNDERLIESPTDGCLIPQNYIEDVLVNALQISDYTDIRFSTKLLEFAQFDDHVQCRTQDLNTKEIDDINCQYLIAADGAHSGIRNTLNISMNGIPTLGTYLSIFANVDLTPWLGDKLGAVYTLAGKDQVGRFLMAVDHKSKWIFSQRIEKSDQSITEKYCKEIIRSFLNNANVNIDIINHSTWDMAALNAERYRDRRIFLVGDAATRMPPTGGMGMNTGLGGAHNLAWKLAYVLKGYADYTLLDTYEQERKPVADFTMAWSTSNAKRMFSMYQAIHTDMDSFKEKLKAQQTHINHLGLCLGFVYRSDAIYSDDHHSVPIDPDHYTASSKPGMRAPHVDITMNDKTKSILNLFKDDYVLLLSPNAHFNQNELPIPKGYPLKIYQYKKDFTDPNGDFQKKYNLDHYHAILVRPDGHIALRR